MQAYLPLPIAATRYGLPGYRDFAFKLFDAQGMYPRPPGRHGAVDWFAEGGESVRAARPGIVVEHLPSRGNTGQVFGGVLKVKEPAGRVWVYRHVDPVVGLGSSVGVADVIARVTKWVGGPSHLHLEIWKTLAGGYNHANAEDPGAVDWQLSYGAPEPPPMGGSLVLTVGERTWRGWEEAGPALLWVARKGLRRKDVGLAFNKTVVRGRLPVIRRSRQLVNTYLGGWQ